MLVLKVIFWASLAALVWTHALYPLFVAALARLRPRPARADESFRPRVALVIAAYNEDDVIERKLENALALDYPRERLRIVVASDASSDGTDEIVRGFADRGVELVRAPRGGKVNAQNHTVRTLTDVDVVAFSDANCEWAPDALAAARRAARRSPRRLRLRPAAAALARGHEPGGRVLALRDLAAGARVARALGHGRQRLHLRACAASATRRSTRASGTTSRSRT